MAIAKSSIIKDGLEEGHRATHSRIGKDAEKRVATILRGIYGDRKVVVGSSHSSGTAGKPDVLLMTDPPVLVEVKTCTLFHRRRIFGAAKTFMHSWLRLSEYAKTRRMDRIMVIEYRHKGDAVYAWIRGEEVDRMIEDRKKINPIFEVFHFTFREAMQYGKILTDKGFMIIEPDSSQERMDGFLRGFLGPLVKGKPRSRNKDGTWRKKRSDAGRPRIKRLS